MTKKDKATLLKAACRIACGQSHYSCVAIATAGDAPAVLKSRLVREYGEFYEKAFYLPWFGVTVNENERSRIRNQRILLLLWFREVGLEGIGLE